MVLDKYKDNTIPRYLIYDVVRLGEKDIGKQPFYEDRLNCIQKEIIGKTHKTNKLSIK